MSADERPGSRIRETICAYTHLIWSGFVIAVVLFVLSLFAFAFVERGTGSHSILLVDMVLIGGTAAVSLALLIWCRLDRSGDVRRRR